MFCLGPIWLQQIYNDKNDLRFCIIKFDGDCKQHKANKFINAQ